MAAMEDSLRPFLMLAMVTFILLSFISVWISISFAAAASSLYIGARYRIFWGRAGFVGLRRLFVLCSCFANGISFLVLCVLLSAGNVVLLANLQMMYAYISLQMVSVVFGIWLAATSDAEPDLSVVV